MATGASGRKDGANAFCESSAFERVLSELQQANVHLKRMDDLDKRVRFFEYDEDADDEGDDTAIKAEEG